MLDNLGDKMHKIEEQIENFNRKMDTYKTIMYEFQGKKS